MRGRRIALVGFATAVVVGACANDLGPKGSGGTGGTVIRTCDDLSNPPPGCGTASCVVDADCAGAMHCLNLLCTAQCTPTEGCGSGEMCTPQGRCVPNQPDGGSGGIGGDGGCPSTTVNPSRETPNVLFVVDKSGSMDDHFGSGKDRWTAAHDAITEVVQNVSAARFGLVTFTRDGGPPVTCPDVGVVNLDFDLMSISDTGVYPRNYPGGGDTPTGDSLDEIVSLLGSNPPPADGPTVFVLATDGEPDTCEQPNPDQGQAEAIAAAQAAYSAGYSTYILGVGDGVGATHLNRMANVGVGRAPNDSNQAPAYTANTVAELEAAFDEIVGNQLTCDVALNANIVPSRLCDGTVTMDGNVLTCMTDYRLKPGTNDTIELLGTACDTWKATGQVLSAEFDCGVVVE